MSAWTVERFHRDCVRADFDCGVPLLNEWIQKFAGQYERRDLARTYIAVEDGQTRVCGYYALSNHRVSFEALPVDQARGLPRIDVPVVLLGRLAVDRTCQGTGLGALLLIDALRRAQQVADQIGVRAVEVRATNDAARRFYLKYGFIELIDDPQHLFLPMQVIRKLKLPPLA